MVAQFGLRLAASLIKSHFGDVVGNVCDCLLRKGSLSLDELRKFTKMPTSQVKECLLVLIQHNCVQAFSIPGNFGGDLGTVTQYMALFDNILHRLRFPKFSVIVENHLGEQCASLFRGVLQNGRVTFNQLVDRDQAGSKGARDRETLREDFNKLIHTRYVERCPKPDPFIAPDSEEDAPAKKRGSKFVADVQTIEKKAVAEATLFEAERFREIRPRVQCGGEESAEHNDNVTVGEKRKHEKLEIDDETQAMISENEVVWRPNYEKFIGNLRNQICLAKMRSKLDSDAIIILEAMLELSERNIMKGESSVTLSIDTIVQEVSKKLGGSLLTMERVRAGLDLLGSKSLTGEEDGLYKIELRNLIDVCRVDEMESVVLGKFGNEAYRIFRHLADKNRPIEADQVSEFTLVERKVAHGILYKLWKDDYLHMQVVTHGPSNGYKIFLWKVNKDSIAENALNDIYHAALNLNQQITEFKDIYSDVLSDLKKARKMLRALESSLMKLDESLMLFNDF